MRNNALRWIVLLAALVVLGPLACALTASLRGADGGRQASLLVNDSVLKGVLAALGVFGLAGVAGLTGARLNGLRHGMFAAGLVLAWGAWGTGQIDRILHRTLSSSTMWALAGEGVVVGALAVGLAAAMTLIAREPEHARSAHPHHHHHAEPRTLLDRTTPGALLAGIVAGAIIGWLIAQDTLKGQTFAAATLAGLFAATAGRFAAAGAPAVTFVGALALLSVVSPIVATFVHPSALGPVRAALAGTLFPLARPLPLDWAAGAFVGVPLGLSWATSLVDRREPHSTGAAAAR